VLPFLPVSRFLVESYFFNLKLKFFRLGNVVVIMPVGYRETSYEELILKLYMVMALQNLLLGGENWTEINERRSRFETAEMKCCQFQGVRVYCVN